MTQNIEHHAAEAAPLTVEEVAMRLKCSVSTVWRMVKRGVLTTHPHFGRTVFDSLQVEELLTRGRQ
jgi:excisionase family DNA binding protein